MGTWVPPRSVRRDGPPAKSSGHSRRVDDRVELEARYIRDWSLQKDVQILIQSVVVAFTVQA